MQIDSLLSGVSLWDREGGREIRQWTVDAQWGLVEEDAGRAVDKCALSLQSVWILSLRAHINTVKDRKERKISRYVVVVTKISGVAAQAFAINRSLFFQDALKTQEGQGVEHY